MKDFAGKWTVQPFTQNTLNGIYSKAEQPANAAPWHSLTSSLTRREPAPSSALASLLHGRRASALACDWWVVHLLVITCSYMKLCDAGMGDSKAEASLVTLEQSLEPNFRPPKPFDGLVKGLLFQTAVEDALQVLHEWGAPSLIPCSHIKYRAFASLLLQALPLSS
jgi:hypothetical protein